MSSCERTRHCNNNKRIGEKCKHRRDGWMACRILDFVIFCWLFYLDDFFWIAHGWHMVQSFCSFSFCSFLFYITPFLLSPPTIVLHFSLTHLHTSRSCTVDRRLPEETIQRPTPPQAGGRCSVWMWVRENQVSWILFTDRPIHSQLNNMVQARRFDTFRITIPATEPLQAVLLYSILFITFLW
jgi:hypothetical protein